MPALVSLAKQSDASWQYKSSDPASNTRIHSSEEVKAAQAAQIRDEGDAEEILKWKGL